MTSEQVESYTHLARCLAQLLGPNCEVIVHDLETDDINHTIVDIENGYISGRKIGDGPSHVVLEAIHGNVDGKDYAGPYLTKTADGKLLKSSTVFIYGPDHKVTGILGFNFDITLLTAVQTNLNAFLGIDPNSSPVPEPITRNVADLLDDLFAECEIYVGKPAALMTKDERIRAIGYLDSRGAFLISKSSQKACDFFKISKYSFYSYLEEAKQTFHE